MKSHCRACLGAALLVIAGLTEAESTAAPAAAPAALPTPSMDDFLAPSALEDLTLSPNGEYLAYANRLDNGRYVFQVLRLKDKAVVGSFGFTGDNDIGDIYWVNDTRLIFGIARKRASSERPKYTNELHSIDFDGKNHKVMLGPHVNALGYKTASSLWRSWQLVTTQTDEPNVIIVSDYVTNGFDANEYRKYFKLNVATARSIEIGQAPGRFGASYADSKGVIRLADGEDENGDSVNYYREKSPGGWQEIGREKLSGPGRKIIGFAPDETKVLAYERGEDGLDTLVRIDPKTDGSEVLYAEPGKSLGRFRYDADQRSLLYVETDRLSGKRHWFLDQNPRAEGIQQTLEASPSQRLEIVDFSRNGERAVLKSVSSAGPGSYYVVDFTTGQLLLMHNRAPQLKGKAAATQKIVQIKARDGLLLPSILTRAAAAPAEGKPPMVVLVHGGPHFVCDLAGYNAEVQMLASRGYSVLQVNYRGSGCFGEDFQKKGYRQWGAAMQDDLTDATRWAIAEGQADAKRICIYGASYGGYAALMGAVKEPDLYRCAVGYAGVYDLKLMRSTGDIPEGESGRNYLDTVIGKDKAELEARSPASQADKIKIPLLLAHGEDDERAPLEQFNAMTAGLKAADRPFTTFLRKAEEHGFYSIQNRREFWTELLAFFDKHIGAGSLTAQPSPAAAP